MRLERRHSVTGSERLVDHTRAENQQNADRAVLTGDRAAGASSIEMHRETVNAEHRGEVASLYQAPPRQSISTKTLRMVRPPYDAARAPVSRFHRVFDMRDSRPAMKDSNA